MKKILILALAIAPAAGFAQCEKIIGAPTGIADSIVINATKHLQFKLDTTRSSQAGFVLQDKDQFCSLRVSYSVKSELVGSELVSKATGIKSVYISGPKDRIEALYSAYFLPKTQCGKDVSPTVRTWWGQKIVHVEYGSVKTVPTAFIEIESL